MAIYKNKRKNAKGEPVIYEYAHICVTLRPALFKKFQAQCGKDDVGMSEQIKQWIRKYVDI